MMWTFDFTSIMVGIATFAITQSKYVSISLDLFLVGMLKMIVVNPKTSTFKEVRKENDPRAKFYTRYADYAKDEAVIDAIRTKGSLKLCAANEDCARIVSILLRNKHEFMTADMDFIVISKMGIDLLVLEMEGHGEDRSVFLDLTVFRASLISMHRWLSFLLTFGITVIVSSGDVRMIASKLFGQSSV